MKKGLVAAAVCTGALAVLPGSASADPAVINGHNCAGFFVSAFAEPGFGEAVSEAAHEQEVDNFGFANCFQDNRNNP
jgi:hypothetical protein